MSVFTDRQIENDLTWMRLALRLARRAYGETSPNPLVGAVLVKNDRLIGQGWHRQAGGPHAEIEAICDSNERGENPKGATLYVTLEPCCTQGRTPPCTKALIEAGIKEVVAAATDPNPKHSGRAFEILRTAGIKVRHGLLAAEAAHMNEAFNHWIVHRTPFVTVKAAMTLDGKIATANGESKWITGELARRHAMKLRQGADAVLVGVNTVLLDDPSLTFRPAPQQRGISKTKHLRRIVLDSKGRTPLESKIVTDENAAWTTLIVSEQASRRKVKALQNRVSVLTCPSARGHIDLPCLLRRLGEEDVTCLLVEGGGEVNASFLLGGFAQRVAFFYAPKILGGHSARRSVGGCGSSRLSEVLQFREVIWRGLGQDLFMTARLAGR